MSLDQNVLKTKLQAITKPDAELFETEYVALFFLLILRPKSTQNIYSEAKEPSI